MKQEYNKQYKCKDFAYTNKKNFKIPFKTYGKTIVIGRNCEILNGLDSVFVGQNRFQDFLRDVYKMWDFFTPTILVEGNKFVIGEKIHNFFIEEQMRYKMFYLEVPKEILDKRSKKRDNGYDRKVRTDSLVNKEINAYNEIVTNLDYKEYIEVRKSKTKKQCEEIASEIFEMIQNENSLPPK